jgi:hypothetical protein
MSNEAQTQSSFVSGTITDLRRNAAQIRMIKRGEEDQVTISGTATELMLLRAANDLSLMQDEVGALFERLNRAEGMLKELQDVSKDAEAQEPLGEL